MASNIHNTKAGIFVAKKAFGTYPSLKDFEQTNLSADNFVKLGYNFTNVKIYQIVVYEYRF